MTLGLPKPQHAIAVSSLKLISVGPQGGCSWSLVLLQPWAWIASQAKSEKASATCILQVSIGCSVGKHPPYRITGTIRRALVVDVHSQGWHQRTPAKIFPVQPAGIQAEFGIVLAQPPCSACARSFMQLLPGTSRGKC